MPDTPDTLTDAEVTAIEAEWRQASDRYPGSLDGLAYMAAVELANEAHATVNALLAEARRARGLLAAADAWGRARREEETAKRMSYEADHRGPAWFARCVAGETRVAAEEELFAAWEQYAPARAGGGAREQGE